MYTGYLLHGLPESYKTVKIICGQSQNNVNSVKNILLSKYSQQKRKAILAKNSNGNSNSNNNPANAHAFTAGKDGRDSDRGRGLNKGQKGANKSSRTCYNCGKIGYISRFCTEPRFTKSSNNLKKGEKLDKSCDNKSVSRDNEPRR
jgi:hypothetical protein